MTSNRFIKVGVACAGGVLPVMLATPAGADTYEYDDREEISLSAGGGVTGFTDSDTADMLDVGGSWDVRAHFGTRSGIGVEAAYIGSAQGVNTFGVDNDAILVGNGVEAAMRFNILPDYTFQPYLVIGAAWRRYDLTETDLDTNLSPINGEDDVFEVPLAAGFAWYLDDVVIDARAQFRTSYDNDLLENLDDDDDLHRWGVSANVGYEF